MKAIVKWVLIPVGTLGALIASGVGYLFAAFPKAEEPAGTKVTATPELVQRGHAQRVELRAGHSSGLLVSAS